MADTDRMLRRVERGALVACLAMAAVAWPVDGWRLAAPLGVLGGGLLVAVSYRGIKAGIDAVVVASTEGPPGRRKAALGMVKFFTRFGILALVAYVIMGRLRMPPVAVFAGASSLVFSVAAEALHSCRSRRQAGSRCKHTRRAI